MATDPDAIHDEFIQGIDTDTPGLTAFDYGTVQHEGVEKYDPENPHMYFADALPLDSVNLKRLTPFQPGRGYFFPAKMPAFMEDVFPERTEFFKRLLIVYAIGIDGITNPTINYGEVTSGVENQGMEVPENRGGSTNEITFTFPTDFRGQFITKYLYTWMNGMLDENSDKGHYYGSDLEYSNANHSMSGAYFTVDPSERRIEFASYVFNMQPKEAPLNINNKTKGDNTPQEITPAFTARMITGNKNITKICYENLRTITQNTNGTTAFNEEIVSEAEDIVG